MILYNLQFFIEPVQELIKRGSSLNGLTFLYFIRERNRFSMKFCAKIITSMEKRHPQTLEKGVNCFSFGLL